MKVKDLISILSKFNPESNMMCEMYGFEELPGSYDDIATRVVLPKKCKYKSLAELEYALNNSEIDHEEYHKILAKSYYEFSPVPMQVVFRTYKLVDWIENEDPKGKRVKSETFGSYEWWTPCRLKEIIKDSIDEVMEHYDGFNDYTLEYLKSSYLFVKTHLKEIKKRKKINAKNSN